MSIVTVLFAWPKIRVGDRQFRPISHSHSRELFIVYHLLFTSKFSSFPATVLCTFLQRIYSIRIKNCCERVLMRLSVKGRSRVAVTEQRAVVFLGSAQDGCSCMDVEYSILPGDASTDSSIIFIGHRLAQSSGALISFLRF